MFLPPLNDIVSEVIRKYTISVIILTLHRANQTPCLCFPFPAAAFGAILKINGKGYEYRVSIW
jgi:hypothetical protein